MKIPTIIQVPCNFVQDPRMLQRIQKLLTKILGIDEFLLYYETDITEWDIILPRFVSWRKYRKLKKKALKNLKKLVKSDVK